jgi:tRNA (cytidine/uridine-2'-O-)-methyltransferase
MLHLALYQPEIPENTGNIIRLCANTGARLHLIQPLGFVWDDRRLRRAGLDYHQLTHVHRHRDYSSFTDAMRGRRLLAASTRGQQRYCDTRFADEDVLLMGPETRGLPQDLLATLPADQQLRIPMRDCSRSLNLANASAILVYEAWRQLGFADFEPD